MIDNLYYNMIYNMFSININQSVEYIYDLDFIVIDNINYYMYRGNVLSGYNILLTEYIYYNNLENMLCSINNINGIDDSTPIKLYYLLNMFGILF